MVDNTGMATKSALQTAFSSATSLPILVSPGQTHSHFPGSQSHQPAGGMKLEAVMENLQRQQAARLAVQERLRQAEKEKHIRSLVEVQIKQRTLALGHYQAAIQSALAAGEPGSPLGTSSENRQHVNRDLLSYNETEEHSDSASELADDPGTDAEDRDLEEGGLENGGVVADVAEGESRGSPSRSSLQRGTAAQTLPRAGRQPCPAPGQSQSPGGATQHEWTYEEQFRQLYELDDDEKRKEFLDDLFSFMQKRGTPVNRIPIMAKQVLDLYTLYKLVTEKGGLVEVINKKIWREITKGLNLPTSITSAAFTLRTQYMKYLYPYECAKRGLSSPGELQVAIDSNRREGRKQGFGAGLFGYPPVGTAVALTPPKVPLAHVAAPSLSSGRAAPVRMVKNEENTLPHCMSSQIPVATAMAGHHLAAAQAAALEQLRETLECGEPARKKVLLAAEEQQMSMQRALQRDLVTMATQLPMNIKLNSRDDRQGNALNLSTNGISSINMSIEINGVVYTGVLFARKSATAGLPSRSRNGRQESQGKSILVPAAHSQSPASPCSSGGSGSASGGPVS
ncbi:AT-rich interactive domain-containing protein 3A-like isoform X2 [Paramormyrops kingsleyae]|uniref:AT-rich interactive domain-containing protein 3 n=1 Tax=Paramormyrops kingsleyae TaxID=1676925 RepID=A0A3B3SY08_9TELE|nr:AT-rich interactive domain-containing protein 3A-like isoform X2 [Paramormyrops kingsleyae]